MCKSVHIENYCDLLCKQFCMTFFLHSLVRGCPCSTAWPYHLSGQCRHVAGFKCYFIIIANLVIALSERAGECSCIPGLSSKCPGAVRASGDVGGDGRVSAVRRKDGEGRGSAASATCCERDANTMVSTG